MAVRAAQVSCPSNAATIIVPAINTGVDGSVGQRVRRTVNVSNPSAQTIWLGGDNTVTNGAGANPGFPLLPGATITLQLALGDVVYGIGDKFSPSAAYIEAGV